MQFYLSNIRHKSHHRPTFIRKLCYTLSIVTFTFIQIFDLNFVFFTEWRENCCICLIQHQNSRYFR